MKKILYILDEFTYGHEAALKFIERKSVRNAEFELIFCGTHAEVFRKLSESNSYAVVPVTNSLIGTIDEVYLEHTNLKNAGYKIKTIDSYRLKVGHCLIVSEGVTSITDIKEILSKKEVFQQCKNFLDSEISFSHSRTYCDSTGDALSKFKSRSTDGTNIGAIVPLCVARKHGFKILFESVQDSEVVYTTFDLIRNVKR